VTVIAIGRMVGRAVEAANALARAGIESTVLDPRTLSPLDSDSIIESAERTGRVVIVDESYPRCGAAADIAALIAEDAFAALKAPVVKVTPPHCSVPYAPELENAFIPSAARIETAVRRVMAFKR
jgi:pyruvate dehydrogenase E1 component beta subunit